MRSWTAVAPDLDAWVQGCLLEDVEAGLLENDAVGRLRGDPVRRIPPPRERSRRRPRVGGRETPSPLANVEWLGQAHDLARPPAPPEAFVQTLLGSTGSGSGP